MRVCVLKLIKGAQSKIQHNPGKLKPDQMKKSRQKSGGALRIAIRSINMWE